MVSLLNSAATMGLASKVNFLSFAKITSFFIDSQRLMFLHIMVQRKWLSGKLKIDNKNPINSGATLQALIFTSYYQVTFKLFKLFESLQIIRHIRNGEIIPELPVSLCEMHFFRLITSPIIFLITSMKLKHILFGSWMNVGHRLLY